MTSPAALLTPRRAGRSGLVLPPISLGLWHSFGRTTTFERQRELVLAAYDAGIWHFDNANRYGPPHGHAEQVLGAVLAGDLAAHRGSIVVSTKAGNPIAEGPYGRGGSRKHLLEALDDSLRRLRLDHVDIFYSHSFDPSVPLDETASALAHAVTSGKAHYVGISNYGAPATREIAALLREAGVPLVLHQFRFSLLSRDAETNGLADTLRDENVGGIVYSPLAQGLLTDRYLGDGIPAGARAGSSEFLGPEFRTEEYLARTRAADSLAAERGQSLAQLALQWVLEGDVVTSAIIGASSVAQLRANVAALDAPPLDAGTLTRLDELYPLP